MKTLIIVCLALGGCAAHGCPVKSVEVRDQCKLDMLSGKATKADCEKRIEESCP